MVEIIKKEDWHYIFFKFASDYYLLIPIAISAVSVQYLLKLNDLELTNYGRLNEKFLSSFSGQVRSSPKTFSERNLYSKSDNILSELKNIDGFRNMTL